MDPHRPISNSIVKGYSGEDTKRGASWENNTMSKLSVTSIQILKIEFEHEISGIYILDLLMYLSKIKTFISI